MVKHPVFFGNAYTSTYANMGPISVLSETAYTLLPVESQTEFWSHMCNIHEKVLRPWQIFFSRFWQSFMLWIPLNMKSFFLFFFFGLSSICLYKRTYACTDECVFQQRLNSWINFIHMNMNTAIQKIAALQMYPKKQNGDLFPKLFWQLSLAFCFL